MIAALDVGYGGKESTAACVLFQNWEDKTPTQELVETIRSVEDYKPGEFYKRELPCLLKVLAKLPEKPNLILIDGFVWLDSDAQKGLGCYLFEALDQRIPVIGIAKSAFKTVDHAVEVIRGQSSRPLYVTAVGVSAESAAAGLKSMHGDHRIPTLLKRVDNLSRMTGTSRDF